MKISTALFTLATLSCAAAAAVSSDVAKAHGHDTGIWKPARPSDSRSPCPVLNSLANHGHLPRDGLNITPAILNTALQGVLNLEPALSDVMATGVLQIANGTGQIKLSDLALHNFIEHDASFVHDDVAPGQLFAPTNVNQTKVKKLLTYANAKREFTWLEFGNVRVDVERESHADNVTFAAGLEISLILQTFGTGNGTDFTMPASSVATLFGKERLPFGFVKPTVKPTLDSFLSFATFIAEKVGELKAAASA